MQLCKHFLGREKFFSLLVCSTVLYVYVYNDAFFTYSLHAGKGGGGEEEKGSW